MTSRPWRAGRAAIRLGSAPAGIILREPDGIVALGAMVARELYGTVVPVVALDPRHYRMLRSGAEVLIDGTAVSQAPTRR
jgi:predicted aconitase with swiveling domain